MAEARLVSLDNVLELPELQQYCFSRLTGGMQLKPNNYHKLLRNFLS